MPPLLALSDADPATLLALIVAALMALGPVLHSYIRVYDWMKGKNIDVSDFVTHKHLAEVKAQRDQQLEQSIGHFNQTTDAINQRLDEVFKLVGTLQNEMPAIHRALGRLEGHDDADRPQRRPH